MLGRMWRKGNSFTLLVGMQTGAAALENSVGVPQKIKNRTTLWPSNCTIRYLSKGYRYAVLKGHMHPNVYSSAIDNSQIMEEARVSINRWMDKEEVVYICTVRYYSAKKRNEILPFATTWMELEGIVLSKIGLRKPDIICFHSYVEFEKLNRWT